MPGETAEVGPLTLTGAVTSLGACACLGLGLWGHYPTLTGVGLAGVAITLLTGLLTARRPSLDVTRVPSQQSVSCGETVRIRLRVRNRGRLLPVRVTASERVRAAGARTDHRLEVAVPLLPAGRETEACYQLPTARRGLLRLGPLEFTRADDFGLWRRTIRTGRTAEVLVRPTVHPVPVELTGTARSVEGVTRDGAGGSTAFHSLRDYVPGDDRRMIHWRSTARRGELTVRQLVDVVLPRLTIVLDTRAGTYPETGADGPDVAAGLDSAIEVAASVAAACAGSGIAVQLVSTSGMHREVAEIEDMATVLDALARIEPDASLGLAEIADRLEVRPGARLLLISGPGRRPAETLDRDLAALQALARRHDGCLALVLDHPESPASEPEVPGAQVTRVADVPAALLAWAGWSRR